MQDNRIFKAKIYTTASWEWYEKDFTKIKETLCKARGVEDVWFSVQKISIDDFGTYVPNFIHPTRVNWAWLKAHIFENTHDMEILHLNYAERDKLGMVHPDLHSGLGGEYDVDKDDIIDTLVIAEMGQMAYGYTNLSEFARVFIHEACHGFAHWTQNNAMGMVHYYDDPNAGRYDLLSLPATFDFRPHTWLTQIVGLLKEMVSLKNKRMTLIEAAEKFLHKDASPQDIANDEVGCAESMTEILKTIFPTFKGSLSTLALKNILDKDSRFIKVLSPSENTIILCATTESHSKTVRNGHVGVIGKDGNIISNSSATGTMEYNYTLQSWKERFENNGYPIHYYKVL